MRATGALVALVLIVTACGAGEFDSSINSTTAAVEAPTNGGNEGGIGAPSQAPGEFALGPGRPVVGELQLAANGCWYAELNGIWRLAIFPTGFDLNPAAGGELVDDAGVIYRDDDRFDAMASIARGSEIPGGPDGKWGNYMSFCRPELEELVVFDTLVHEFEPAALSTEDLTEMLEEAIWTEHFACGRGWATSTADQRVGLVIYEMEPDVTFDQSQIVLPNPDWSASVLFGKNLFAEHCNDAIEDWLALPTIAFEWPLIAGTITIVDPVPAPDESPRRVTANLSAGQVDTGAGPIELPSIELDNFSYNFFAG